ncbi:MAG: hypothetical protein IJZ57_08435 [Clostridia bacterium]|nr:hypothetical protein [Clostridia bacterium]
MKKVISVIMAVVILCVGLLPLSVSAATTCKCDNVPVIYVRGKTPILPDKSLPASKTNHQIPYITGQELEDYITQLVPIYAICYLTGNYDRFSYRLAEIFAEEYKDYALDNNGNITNNSGIAPEFQWSASSIKDNHKPSKTVTTYEQASAEIYKYYYIYDCRVDPFETADDLHKYIETVKKVTGHSTVKILARCYGTNVVSAYFVKYGWDDIEDVVLYNPVMNGTDKLDCIFAGEITMTQESIDYISENYVADTEEDRNLKLLINALNVSGGFDFTNETASYVINFCSPEILRETYATCPGFWAMLSADVYEQSKEHIFTYYEDEFAGLIEKIDNYHENVRLKLDEIYAQMKADGVDIYTIAKYGTQLLPIMEDPFVQSDDTVSVETQVPGTISAPLGTTFGEAYLEDAAVKGNSKYISPDKTIDASRVTFRDTTWYVKNLAHDNFPKCFDLFIYKLLRAKGTFTVNSDKNYPQFMVYENNNGTETVKPLTAVDENDTPLDFSGDVLILLRMIREFIVKFIEDYLYNFILK